MDEAWHVYIVFIAPRAATARPRVQLNTEIISEQLGQQPTIDQSVSHQFTQKGETTHNVIRCFYSKPMREVRHCSTSTNRWWGDPKLVKGSVQIVLQEERKHRDRIHEHLVNSWQWFWFLVVLLIFFPRNEAPFHVWWVMSEVEVYKFFLFFFSPKYLILM